MYSEKRGYENERLAENMAGWSGVPRDMRTVAYIEQDAASGIRKRLARS
jgi:hypothetical protein